jgi:hypothetical protein
MKVVEETFIGVDKLLKMMIECVKLFIDIRAKEAKELKITACDAL